MSSEPKTVGTHRLDDQWASADCGASFDCLSQFRQTACE
jgi:hypothetical protein